MKRTGLRGQSDVLFGRTRQVLPTLVLPPDVDSDEDMFGPPLPFSPVHASPAIEFDSTDECFSAEVSDPEADCELDANLCLSPCNCLGQCLQTLSTVEKKKPLT